MKIIIILSPLSARIPLSCVRLLWILLHLIVPQYPCYLSQEVTPSSPLLYAIVSWEPFQVCIVGTAWICLHIQVLNASASLSSAFLGVSEKGILTARSSMYSFLFLRLKFPSCKASSPVFFEELGNSTSNRPAVVRFRVPLIMGASILAFLSSVFTEVESMPSTDFPLEKRESGKAFKILVSPPLDCSKSRFDSKARSPHD